MVNPRNKMLPMEFYTTPKENIKDWEGLMKYYYKQEFDKPPDDRKHWIFRGEKKPKPQECAHCHNLMDNGGSDLSTSLEQAFANFKTDEKKFCRRQLEDALIREFQRKLYLYEANIPPRNAKLEWLSLMQHYGAPTRLLDCTYSFFAACYFAINEFDCEKEIAAVWAVNAKWVEKGEETISKDAANLKEMMQKQSDLAYMDKEGIHRNALVCYLMDNPKPIVLNLTPFRLNERLTIQQGTFLFPGNISESFIDNLKEMGKASEIQSHLHRIPIEVDTEKRNEILRKLHAMNINQAVLFPGLEGFSKSLKTQLAFPEKFGIQKKNRTYTNIDTARAK